MIGYIETLRIKNGLTIVTKDNKYGVIDTADTEIIPCIYEEVVTCAQEYFILGLDGLYGVLNNIGKEVIQLQYLMTDATVNNSMLAIASNKKAGLISLQGREIIPCIYDSVEFLDIGLLKVELKGRYGIYSLDGEEIISILASEEIDKFISGLVIEPASYW